MKKIALLVGLFVLTVTQSLSAQFLQEFEQENIAIGGGLGMIYHNEQGQTLNLNLRANYVKDPKSILFVNFNYNLPFSYTSNVDAYPIDNVGGILPVNVDSKSSLITAAIGYNYSIIGNNNDPFSIYGSGTFGVGYFRTENTVSAFDNSKYYLPSSINIPPDFKKISGIFDLGLGFNLNFDKTNIFMEAKVGIPSSFQQSDANSYAPTPINFGANVGVTYALFE